MTKSRDIAKILGVTEDNNPSSSRILFLDESLDSARITSIADTTSPSLTVYDSVNELPVQSLVSGAQAYVKSNKRLYVTLNNAYYNIATVNLTPTVTLDPSGTIVLSDSGQPSAIVTMIATDSDGRDADLTFAVESDGNMLGRATLTQDSSVFTINPLTADSGATDGTFTLTFKASDGINIGTATKDFSLTFAATGVSGSASTISLLKAHGNTKTNNDISYYSQSTTTSTGFTEAGDPTAATFSPYRSGGYSAYFDGGGDWIDYGTVSAIGNVGTGDFTYECWFYNTDLDQGSNPTLFAINSYTNGLLLRVNVTTNRDVDVYIANSQRGFAYTFEENTWYHLIWTRESGTVKMWINGEYQSSFTATMSGSITSGNIRIGSANHNTAHDWQGYITDVRFVNGTAEQTGTSDISVPTGRLSINGAQLFTCHLPYIADAAGNATATINGNTKTAPFGPYDYNPWSATDNVGSVHLDGTGDYLTTASSNYFAFGTGDFTWEMWVYHNEYEPAYLLEFGTGGDLGIHHATAQGHLVYYNSTTGTGSSLYTTGFGSMSAGKWYHIAAVRDNGTTYLYTNGVLQTSASDTHNYGSSAIPCRIGANGASGTYPWTGYIADLRILKGTTAYTSAFTPPTEPHARNSSTQLLMQNLTSISTVPDAGVYDAAAAGRVTLTGNWASRSTTRKFTTSSSYGGTGSLQLNDLTPEYTGGDFTIQFWLYPAVWSDSGHIFGHWVQNQYHQYLIYSHTGTDWKFYASSNGSSWNLAHTASVNIARWTDSWKHVAMTYDQSAGTVKFWLDGTLASTHTGITGMASNGYTSSIFSMSADQNAGMSAGSHYVQDLKISRSVEYTTNFTPPTAEFEL